MIPLLVFFSLMAVSCSGLLSERIPSPSPVIIETARPSPEQPYGGAEACGECHKEIYLFWRGTGHAGSFQSLAAGGESQNPSCLRCHSTGFGERSGYADGATTPQLSSVGCESCHGPGGDHAGSAYPALVPVAGGDDCRGCDLGRICRRCHTTGRSPAFNLEGALGLISCANVAAEGSPAGAVLSVEE